MFLAKGKDHWRKLKSFFVDIDNLLLFLKNQDFTGYTHFLLPEGHAQIFIQEGDVVGGVRETERGVRESGPEVVNGILERARREKKTDITVSRLPADTLALVSKIFGFNAQLFYKDLSSDFSSVGKFLNKLKKDAFTGYVEIHLSQNKKQGVIFLENGRIEATLIDDVQVGLKGEAQTDIDLVTSKVVNEVQRVGATFDVYAPQ